MSDFGFMNRSRVQSGRMLGNATSMPAFNSKAPPQNQSAPQRQGGPRGPPPPSPLPQNARPPRPQSHPPAPEQAPPTPRVRFATGAPVTQTYAVNEPPGPSQPESSDPRVAQLTKEISDLKTELNKKVASNKDAAVQFFGLVEGGSTGRVLLFENIPSEMSVDKASAKADRNTWVKLSYPQHRVERTLPNGTTQIETWLRAHAICPHSSDVSIFWVRVKAEDDSPAFRKFMWYPTESK